MNALTNESEYGEELYPLADIARNNPPFTVDKLRQLIKKGMLEALKHNGTKKWLTSEEALNRFNERKRNDHRN
jgi:hypothetical protein